MADLAGQTAKAEREEPYRVRRLEPGDVEGFLALDATVWERDRSRTWFEWKYASNPYVANPPVFVAEHDGEIVGARPFMAFRIRGGGATRLALQPSDTMVHPDHRRRGLFTRMTERAIRTYADGEPAFCFNFPNDQSLPGYRKLGWQPADARVTHYRVQHPRALVSARVDDPATRLVGRMAAPLARWYCRRRWGSGTGDATVERRAGVPIQLLASLYRRRVPDRLHADRDEEFYRWRFASPVWERATYVASRNGEPVAAVVARTRTTGDGVAVTQVAEVVPMIGGDDWETALEGLLGSVLDDHRDADLLTVADSTVPRDLLARLGFRRDDVPPLSLVTERCTLAVRPLGTDFWSVGGRELTDRSDWITTVLERDTT